MMMIGVIVSDRAKSIFFNQNKGDVAFTHLAARIFQLQPRRLSYQKSRRHCCYIHARTSRELAIVAYLNWFTKKTRALKIKTWKKQTSSHRHMDTTHVYGPPNTPPKHAVYLFTILHFSNTSEISQKYQNNHTVLTGVVQVLEFYRLDQNFVSDQQAIKLRSLRSYRNPNHSIFSWKYPDVSPF